VTDFASNQSEQTMTDHRSDRYTLDRRTFLIGATATGILASASCGGSSAELADDTFSIIQRFPSDVHVSGEVRLPFSLSSEKAQFVTDGPMKLGAQIVDVDGAPIGERIEAVRRDVDPAPYYAFRTQIDTPGIYGIVIDGGPATGANFQVFDRAELSAPATGDTLPGFDTPTVDAPGGVEPICTRDPICEFHSVTLTQALTAGKPIAYLVGTPAFCQTGSCAPALEALIEIAPEFAERLVILHAEVYTDLTATDLAPAILALDMRFEPALFITGADGVIIERIDSVWDITELRERLTAAVG
jgi:hypothetical protein